MGAQSQQSAAVDVATSGRASSSRNGQVPVVCSSLQFLASRASAPTWSASSRSWARY